MLRRALVRTLCVLSLTLSAVACSDAGDGTEVQFGYIADYNGASLLAIAAEQGTGPTRASPRN